MGMKSVIYLIVIAKYRNLSRAAGHLLVSQSTLSQFLVREEQKLEAKLISRNHNELIPTHARELCEETCRNIVELQNGLYKKLSNIERSKTGYISIGITPQ